MRNQTLLCTTIIGAALVLGGCKAQVPPSPEVVNKIQTETRRICKFVPTVVTIANLLKVTSFGQIFSIASDICAAVVVNPQADGPGKAGPRLRGVELKGKFVN